MYRTLTVCRGLRCQRRERANADEIAGLEPRAADGQVPRDPGRHAERAAQDGVAIPLGKLCTAPILQSWHREKIPQP
jgi:hypothetical protein